MIRKLFEQLYHLFYFTFKNIFNNLIERFKPETKDNTTFTFLEELEESSEESDDWVYSYEALQHHGKAFYLKKSNDPNLCAYAFLVCGMGFLPIEYLQEHHGLPNGCIVNIFDYIDPNFANIIKNPKKLCLHIIFDPSFQEILDVRYFDFIEIAPEVEGPFVRIGNRRYLGFLNHTYVLYGTRLVELPTHQEARWLRQVQHLVADAPGDF